MPELLPGLDLKRAQGGSTCAEKNFALQVSWHAVTRLLFEAVWDVVLGGAGDPLLLECSPTYRCNVATSLLGATNSNSIT